MLGNFAFTLYELFGYLVPGSLGLLSLTFLYWSLFVPQVPLGVGSFQPGFGTWAAIVVISYIIGHAVQALGNKLLRGVERSAYAMQADAWMRERARTVASEIVDTNVSSLEARWVYRILDEYATQNAKPGDRDMFIYREGFYRGTCIALFFLTLALVVRTAVPGSAIKFSNWLYSIRWWELLATAFISAGLGCLFFQRYRRFTEYRVTRAILSALIVHTESESAIGKPASQQGVHTPK